MPAPRPTHSNPSLTPPAAEEWDFRSCSEDELACCCYYEFARHDGDIKGRVKRLRTLGHWSVGLDPGDSAYYPDAWFRTFFRHLPEFPDSPWLKLDPAKRQNVREACEQIEGPFVPVGPERYVNDEQQYPYFPTDLGPFELRSVHAVEVDWTASDEAILTAFVRWRDANRPAHDVILESRGRGGARELLKFLAACRLMRHFDNNWIAGSEWVDGHAPKHGDDKKNDGVPRYKDDPAWRKAAAKAERLIEAGVGPTPARMLEGKLKASNLTAVQRTKLAVSINQAKRAERREATLREAESLLERAKRVAMPSAKSGD
jgi:hypothetical protein